jgi:hypothetical protein
MRRQYLHLSAYSCDKCTGPVIAGFLTVRENEISKETDIRQVNAMCLSCGDRPISAAGTAGVRHFSPVEWEPSDVIDFGPSDAFVASLDRDHQH